jgi:FIMAH domain
VLDALIEDVNGLSASGALDAGSASSLVAKLHAARRHVEAGKKGPAMNQLSAFIAEVTALVRSGRLTSVQGLALIEQARVVLSLLTV